jgi:outer membrane protein TolC
MRYPPLPVLLSGLMLAAGASSASAQPSFSGPGSDRAGPPPVAADRLRVPPPMLDRLTPPASPEERGVARPLSDRAVPPPALLDPLRPTTEDPAGPRAAGPATPRPGQAAPPRAAAPAAQPAGAGREQALTFRGFIQMLHGSDEQILVQRLEEEISRERVRGAGAIYEPVLNVTTSYDSSYVLNTSNEILQRANQATYSARIGQINTSVAMRAPTGADVEVGYNVARIQNSLQRVVGSQSPEYKAWLGIRVTQPLLRNFGPEATNRPIHVAEAEREMAREAVRQVSAQRMVEGISTYLALQRARERVRIRTRIVELSGNLLADLRAQQGSGVRTSGDVLAVEVSHAQRQAALQQARQDLEEQISDLQARLSAREQERGRTVRPRRYMAADRLQLTAQRISLPESLDEGESGALPPLFTESLSRRPESRFMDNRLTRDDIEVRYATNQTLPDLNLIMRWGIDDLNTAARYRPLTDYARSDGLRYNSWMVGVQLSVPLFGDNRRQSELSAARLRQSQTLTAQRAVQQRVINEVISSVNVLNRVLDVVDQHSTALNQQRRLAALDEELMRQGRRSRVELLRRQIEVLEAEEIMVDNIMLANRASYVASLARGEILSRLELE